MAPTARLSFALPASRLVSVHRGDNMLSFYEVPQLAELFAAYAVLTLVRLPPYVSFH